MSNETAIGWTDFSSNPIKYRNRETGQAVWACVKKSAGCTNCYSEALALRWNKGQAFSRPNIDKVIPFVDEKEIKRLTHDPKLSGKRVFIGDMTDIFGSWVPEAMIVRLFSAFAARKDVTFQCLTKRPERAQALLAKVAFPYDVRQNGHLDWPLPNVWLGTSVENQAAADERIPHLLKAPAAVRFLSCEPLLGPVSLIDVPQVYPLGCFVGDHPRRLDWVIVGGESGPKHRPMQTDWLASLVGQCQAVGVPTYVKQDSGMYPGRQGRIPDDLWLHEFPAAAAAPPVEAGGVG